VPLVHCIIYDTLSQATPNLRQTLLQFINLMNLMSVVDVSVPASMANEYNFAFNVTQEYTES